MIYWTLRKDIIINFLESLKLLKFKNYEDQLALYLFAGTINACVKRGDLKEATQKMRACEEWCSFRSTKIRENDFKIKFLAFFI